MVSGRTLGSHRLISLSEKKQLRAGKMYSDSDDDSEVAALALDFLQRPRRSRLHRKKENIGYKQGYLR